MPSPERSPHEKETLIFSTPEAAQQFRERATEQINSPTPAGVIREREAVGDVVAGEFEQAGEAVASVREPWLHTPAEHEEVQQLVDVAFAKDLPAAIKAAKASPHYPRNLDLLHDVLTGELHQMVAEGKLNRQPIGSWLLGFFAIGLLTLLVIIFLFVL